MTAKPKQPITQLFTSPVILLPYQLPSSSHFYDWLCNGEEPNNKQITEERVDMSGSRGIGAWV